MDILDQTFNKFFKESSKPTPFAVFIVAKLPNGKIAATTRSKDRGENGKIGLPGGKVDEGELPETACERESMEEGWKVRIVKKIHEDIVDGKLVYWYLGKNPIKLKNYKEKYRGILPIESSLEEIANSGYGNEFLKNINLSENTISGIMGTDDRSQFSNDDIYAPDDARIPTLLGVKVDSTLKKSKKKKKKNSKNPLVIRRELIKENTNILGILTAKNGIKAKKIPNNSKFRQTGYAIFDNHEGELNKFSYSQGTLLLEPSFDTSEKNMDMLKTFFKNKKIPLNKIKKKQYLMENKNHIFGKQFFNTNEIYEIAKHHFKNDKSKLKTLYKILKSELEIGIEKEKEHTSNEQAAKKIAIDHLKENPFYYTKLKKAGI